MPRAAFDVAVGRVVHPRSGF